MLNLFLLAGQSHGQTWETAGSATAGPNFEVKSCNRLVDNEPEMTLLISQDYFEENLRGIYDDDEFTFSEEYSYNGYVKTVPEDELLVDFDDECEYKKLRII